MTLYTSPNFGLRAPNDDELARDGAAALRTLALDVDTALTEAVAESVWTDYTPTWTAAGGTPSLGNGTLTGRYMRRGALCHVKIEWIFGTTTNPGSTTWWDFSLPFPAVGWHDALALTMGNGLTSYSGAAGIDAAETGVLMVCHAGYVGASVPFNPWTAGGHIHITGAYEVAAP